MCTSTLTLPWQPVFGSHVFQNLHFFLKIGFDWIFINGIIIPYQDKGDIEGIPHTHPIP